MTTFAIFIWPANFSVRKKETKFFMNYRIFSSARTEHEGLYSLPHVIEGFGAKVMAACFGGLCKCSKLTDF